MTSPTDLPLFTDPGGPPAPEPARTIPAAASPARPAARRLAGRIHAVSDPPPGAGRAGQDGGDSAEPPSLRGHLSVPGDPAGERADPRLVRALRAGVSEALTQDQEGRVLTAAEDGERARVLIRDEITAHNQRLIAVGTPALPPAAQAGLSQAVFDALFGLGALQPLLDRPGLHNLEIRHGGVVWLEFEDGRLEQAPPIAEDAQALIEEVARLAQHGPTARPFDRAHPHVDATLPDGSRLSAQAWFTPYPCVTIRKHQYVDVDLDDLVHELGAASRSIAAFLTAAVRAGRSIVISGVPASGKTTTTRAVLNTLPPSTALAILETEDELALHAMPHRHSRVWTGQELVGGGEIVNGRPAGSLGIAEMIPMALRANAQIIVVGEVRGHEVIAMLEAMQVSHSTVSTIHAANGRDTVERIVTCATKYGEVSTTWAYRQVAQLVDVIVHLDMIDETPLGGRKHRHIDEIVLPQLSGDAAAGFAVPALYRPGPDGRAVPDPAVTPEWIVELERHGFDRSWLDPANGGWEHPLQLRGPHRGAA